MSKQKSELNNNVWITVHDGKMTGIRSINVNPLSNGFCEMNHTMSNDRCICTHCYAFNYASFRKSLREHLENNSVYLKHGVKMFGSLPKYDDEILRFDSFGEIINTNHLINIFNICYKNPSTFHILYSKRCKLIDEFLHLKPSNLRIIESNPLVDDVYEIPKSRCAEMVFNVVTPEYLKNHPEYEATCKYACNECRQCYTKRTAVKYIVELIK